LRGNTTTYTYDAANNVATATYSNGLQRIDQNQIVSSTWTPSFYEYDGGGTVRQLTNAAGSVTDTYDYDAYGNVVNTTGSTSNEFLYRGEQLDSDLSLYYLRARYYNPLTGKFLSQDPYPGEIFRPASLHRYRFANGNPVNRLDPRGMSAEEEEGAVEAKLDLAAEGGEEKVASEVNCELGTTASLMAAVSPEADLVLEAVKIEGSECAAEAERTGETCALCFAAGTPIHTDHGDVPVEAIEVGEEVLASNRKTGKQEYEPVTALIAPHKDKLLQMRVEGEHDPLRPTTTHPFWVKRGDVDGGSWMPASQIRIGDRLLTLKGQWRRVTAIIPIEKEETVYNFTVAKDHDYFVGETGFLVHNAGGCGCHGNTKGNQYAELYKLVDKSGNFLKWGVSQNAATRYSQTFLKSIGSAMAVPIDYGPRSEILALERGLVETEPGPLNNEPWAGCNWIP
jgi:RHS repeat-associated protein